MTVERKFAVSRGAPAAMLGMFVVLSVCTASTPASATVSYALSLDELAKQTTVVVRATPLEKTSFWDGDRIVTMTRLKVDSVIAGSESGAELWVRTLGGVVGNIGHHVDGEASFAAKDASIVFLHRESGPNVFTVAGHAQGQLVVTKDARTTREVVRLRGLGGLVPRPRRIPQVEPPISSTILSLDGRDAVEATQEVSRAWERNHAR